MSSMAGPVAAVVVRLLRKLETSVARVAISASGITVGGPCVSDTGAAGSVAAGLAATGAGADAAAAPGICCGAKPVTVAKKNSMIKTVNKEPRLTTLVPLRLNTDYRLVKN